MWEYVSYRSDRESELWSWDIQPTSSYLGRNHIHWNCLWLLKDYLGAWCLTITLVITESLRIYWWNISQNSLISSRNILFMVVNTLKLAFVLLVIKGKQSRWCWENSAWDKKTRKWKDLFLVQGVEQGYKYINMGVHLLMSFILYGVKIGEGRFRKQFNRKL